jgi:hypothetical protein
MFGGVLGSIDFLIRGDVAAQFVPRTQRSALPFAA